MFYTDSHEWVRVDGDSARVGITKVASKELETIERICMPKVGQVVQKGEELVILESTKAASDSYAPVSGTILNINQALLRDPSSIHQDPEGTGWMFEMSLSDSSELEGLLSESDYLDSLNVSL